MRRFAIFLVLFSLLFCFCGITAASSQTELRNHPNILLVTIDTLRADYIGAYGNRIVKTPNIDRIAREGVLFKQCVAHCPTTLPSHTSIFTGTTPAIHGIHDNTGYRAGKELLTIAEICRDNGYRTAAFVSAFVLDSRFGLDQGFEFYDDFIKPAPDSAYYAERSATQTVAATLEWLLENRSVSKPWFVWTHLFDPHAPYEPAAPFDRAYAGNPYAGEVSAVDAALTALFENLNDNGELERTIIVITSDHGEGLGEHGEATHGIFAYNSTLHVPLIIRAPGLPRGNEVARRVRHIDLLPTILELAGIPMPQGIEGESLVTIARGQKITPAPDSYFEALQGWVGLGWAPLRGVYRGSGKFIDLPIAEYYDIENDWAERKNLITRSARDARASLTWLNSYLTDHELRGRRFQEDSEALERLKSLGYITTYTPPNPDRKWTKDDDPKALFPLHRMINKAKLMNPGTHGAEAERILRDVIRRRPTTYDAYEALALNLSARGKGEEAVAMLRKTIDAGLTDRLLVKTYADMLFEVGNSLEAFKIFKSLAVQYPEDAELAAKMGACLFEMNDLKAAEVEFRRAISLDSTFMQARVNLAGVLMDSGKITEAERQIDEAIGQWPQFAPALEIKGIILQSRKNLEAARRQYSAALAAEPKRYSALYRLCLVLVASGKTTEATSAIKEFLKSAPKDRYSTQLKELEGLLKKLTND